ncbi:putative baseplate assembly protein [Deinococcus indicus]|uniref:Putative baseplate assembly protein n=1 Tax=Deinococcus indicus TaxID=223556 RepID=A0A246BLE2_9DEIO|nr:putative baseplate assembly protein [Deinococcus indicus]OWL96144.1 putative baseplate assembly protein [Deinococcus indicus]GHG28209.1 putative baseplate assembly protein [Deinococcus indicus]
MPLPTVNLDDRRFDDILEEARRLIPQYCPEWTDHNASDPGIAIIEIFAWMTDLLLYRVNQVPDKLLIAFLEMIGVQLAPPRAAVAPVTLYLSAPQDTPLVIAAGTEVATLRTEVNEATVFSTERAGVIRPPTLTGLFTANTLAQVRLESEGTASAETAGAVRHDLAQLGLPGHRFPIFQPEPRPGDALFLQLADDHSEHVLALSLGVELAGGAGVNPNHPPYVWEAWQGGVGRWVPCEVEYDGTHAFNVSGELILRLPAMREGAFFDRRGYWLRCRLTNEQMHAGYKVSPDLETLQVDARGITVPARHATVVMNELLGQSTGVPGQRFRLLHGPVLNLDPDRDVVEATTAEGDTLVFTPVIDFSESGPEDRHFTLDTTSGEVAFGPSILQPDGSVYRFGAAPPPDAAVRLRRYQYGGGASGNVPARTLTVLKSSVPYVARVTNHAPAAGGRNGQQLEDALHRVPSLLRTRTRAVTADDYEFLAAQVPGVARARCVTPNMAVPGQTYPGSLRALNVPAGQVTLALLPGVSLDDLIGPDSDVTDPLSPLTGRIAPERLTLSAELRAAAQEELDLRRPVGTTLDLRAPQYVWVSVTATIRSYPGASRPAREDVRRRAMQALYGYLNPFTGGPDGRGWPFGRTLSISELYGLLRGVSGVEVAEDVQVVLTEPGQPQQRETVTGSLPLPPQALIVSDVHHVRVDH